MKKIYLIGLLLTLGLISLRIFLSQDLITPTSVIRDVLIGLFASHILLAISYAGMSLIRIIFQSWFSELKIIGFWLSNIITTILIGYMYVRTIKIDFWFFSAFSGFLMLMVGLLLESYSYNTIEFKVDKNAKEIKDEDFKIQFK